MDDKQFTEINKTLGAIMLYTVGVMFIDGMLLLVLVIALLKGVFL